MGAIGLLKTIISVRQDNGEGALTLQPNRLKRVVVRIDYLGVLINVFVIQLVAVLINPCGVFVDDEACVASVLNFLDRSQAQLDIFRYWLYTGFDFQIL